MGVIRDTDWFISKSKSIHGDRFDYSNSKYINSSTPIEIRCIKHNHIFHQLSRYHFNSPNACKDCLDERKRAVRKPPKGKSLAEVYPELAAEWHLTKNGELTPNDVLSKTNTVVWWKCPKGDDHEYETRINSRAFGSGCPICHGITIVKSNSLATLYPELAAQWHPTKNGDLTPDDVGKGSNTRVWWKCPKGDDHEWDALVMGRVQNPGCSVCNNSTIVRSNSLGTLKPELAAQWHPTKNGDLTVYDVSPRSSKRVWWKCPKGDDHEFHRNTNQRQKANGEVRECPICTNLMTVTSNCLETTHPELAAQWHPTKNGDLTPLNINIGYTKKKIWWKCPKGDDHIWNTKIQTKESKICPMCHTITRKEYENVELHKTKNEGVNLKMIFDGSVKKVWWQCKKNKNHIWLKSPSKQLRNKKNVCPLCKLLVSLRPDLIEQWHPTLNSHLDPYTISAHRNIRVYWKCPKGHDHIWSTMLFSRVEGSGCPYCNLTPQSKQELTITFELIQFFKEINPRGFKTRIDGKLWSIDIYIPKLNLGIEFDGSHWHKDKRALDKLKTEQLEDEGFEIFRVREEPLKRIFDDDIMSKQPFNAKQVTNDILTQIMSRYTLDAKKIAKIESYITKKELQNEKGLDKYINMILTEKAEKKL